MFSQTTIPPMLQLSLCIGVICYFIFILFYIKRKMLELKYTLIWLCAGILMIILIFFPNLLALFNKLLGIKTFIYGLFFLLFAFILTVLMMLTAIASRTMIKVRQLIQENGMLEKRIRDLEDCIASKDATLKSPAEDSALNTNEEE